MTAVHEVMSTSPVTVTPPPSVGELLVLFDRHDFNALPVLDERERLVGIVSKLDLLQLFLADRVSTPSDAEAIGPARVADLMRHQIVSIEAREPISAAGAVMVATKLRSLPVVERRARPSHVGWHVEPGRCAPRAKTSARRGQLRPAGTGLMMPPTRVAAKAGSGTGAQNPGRQQTIEMLIDEMGAESFPASDPPAWGVVSSRLEQAVRASG